jgi:hypothetical protein
MTHILEIYKNAWETHNHTLLHNIFCEDAIYQEKPNNILSGIKEIENYWDMLAKTQKNVLFNVKDIQKCNDVLIVEWNSQFERIDLKELWKLEGIMTLHLKENKIAILKEYFFIQKYPLNQ